MRVFAIGAYGTNNVGDEAIFEGLSVRYPDCVPIHIGKSSRRNAIFFEDVLRNPDFFQPGDYLIVGGGGLLYDKRPIQLFIDLAQAVRRRDGRMDVLGLGCEAAGEGYYAEIRELVALADNVTVRSTISQDILKQITGQEAQVQDDFAFSLRAKIAPASGSNDEIPHIGIVTSGDYLENFDELCRVIKTYTGGRPRAKFHHIPHSRAYFDSRNNDVTVGQCLWSSIDIYFGSREDVFFAEPFSCDPLLVLNRYRRLDGVVSQRYHGLVFSKIVGIPHLVMNGNSRKNHSFVADHAASLTHVSKTNADLFDTFSEFFDLVTQVRSRRHTNTPTMRWRNFANGKEEILGAAAKMDRPELTAALSEFFGGLLLQAARASLEKDEKKKADKVNMLKSLPLPQFGKLTTVIDRGARSKAELDETSKILKSLVPNVPFSEEWYLARYPDIARAISRGAILSPRSHFVEFGYYEGREGVPENPWAAEPQSRIDVSLARLIPTK